MIVGFKQTNSFEIYVMDLMQELKDKIKTAEDLALFSTELHESIETAIRDMLEVANYGINLDDYEAQF